MDQPMMASPEVVKGRKEAELVGQNTGTGCLQFQSEKMTQQSTPMTNKHLNMFQSPGPTQSYARMHALYGSTPAPAAFMSAEQHQQDQLVNVSGRPGHPNAHTAFKSGTQGSLSVHFGGPMTSTIHHTDSKKNSRTLAPLGPGQTMGGPGGSGEVATPVFRPAKNAAGQQVCTDKFMAQQMAAA